MANADGTCVEIATDRALVVATLAGRRRLYSGNVNVTL